MIYVSVTGKDRNDRNQPACQKTWPFITFICHDISTACFVKLGSQLHFQKLKRRWRGRIGISFQQWRLRFYKYLFRMSYQIEQVIQGLHMVSGSRCPAWSDQLKKWSESRAAAPKGRCPVGHRGEFPDVLRRPLGYGAIFHVIQREH